MDRIKLFTHTDLDGIGCEILAKFLWNEGVSVENIEAGELDERFIEFCNSEESKQYNIVYITDISLRGNEEAIQCANKLYEEKKDFRLLDHHSTALDLNKYPWANVIIRDSKGEPVSGTWLFFEMVVIDIVKDDISDFYLRRNIINDLEYLATIIRRYDTWTWKTKYNDETPKKLNDLLSIIGKDRFIDDITYYLEDLRFDYPSCDRLLDNYKQLLEIEEERIDRYVNSKNNKIIKMINSEGAMVGVIFADQYISQLGNRLSEMNPDLDYIAIINGENVSLRTTKDNIDLGVIAKNKGGGGHKLTSGYPLSNKDINSFLDNILN